MIDHVHETTECSGEHKCRNEFQKENYAPGFFEVMKATLKGCPRCFKKKLRCEKTKVFKASLKTDTPNQRWFLDHTHIDGTPYRLLCVIDHYSKRGWGSVTKTENTEEVLELLQKLFQNETRPLTISCDNGPAFKSKAFKKFLESHDIIYRPGLPYWPQGQGVVERFNKTIKENVILTFFKKSITNIFCLASSLW